MFCLIVTFTQRFTLITGTVFMIFKQQRNSCLFICVSIISSYTQVIFVRVKITLIFAQSGYASSDFQWILQPKKSTRLSFRLLF